MTLNYYSDVKDGKLQANVRNLISKELPFFNGKRVEVIIKKLTSTRSTQQNRLWWMYITIISNEIGYNKDELHEIAKFKFLKMEAVIENTGEIVEYIGSTAKLGKNEFSELVFKLKLWAQEMFNITLSEPGENF